MSGRVIWKRVLRALGLAKKPDIIKPTWAINLTCRRYEIGPRPKPRSWSQRGYEISSRSKPQSVWHIDMPTDAQLAAAGIPVSMVRPTKDSPHA